MPTVTKPEARERLVALWSMRETLGLVEVLEQINALLEQGHITAEDLVYVKTSSAALKRTASSAASRSEDVGDALVAFRRKRAQRRKEQSAAAINKPRKRYSDWSPAAIFGGGSGISGDIGGGVVVPQSNDRNQFHHESEAQAVKENAISNYAAEVFQRCWRTGNLRHNMKTILGQRPYSRFRCAILAVQRSFRACRRRRRFRAAVAIQRQFQVWKLRLCYSKFLRGLRLFVNRWRMRRHSYIRKNSASVIQRTVRLRAARQSRKRDLLERVVATRILQGMAKRWVATRRMVRTRAATKLQAYMRARQVQTRVKVQKRAALTLQSWSRRMNQRRQILCRDYAAGRIQQGFRAHLICNAAKQQRLHKHIVFSALQVQMWFRREMLRHRMKLLKEMKLHGAACKITRFVRDAALQRIQACIAVQRWLRWLAMRRQARQARLNEARERDKNAAHALALLLQLEEQRILQAHRTQVAKKIQAMIRGKIAKQRFRKVLSYVIVIQRAVIMARRKRLVSYTTQKIHKDKKTTVNSSKVAFYCSAFLKNGDCSKGDACMFIHVASSEPPKPSAPRSTHVLPKQAGRAGAGRLYGGTNSTIGQQPAQVAATRVTVAAPAIRTAQPHSNAQSVGPKHSCSLTASTTVDAQLENHSSALAHGRRVEHTEQQHFEKSYADVLPVQQVQSQQQVVPQRTPQYNLPHSRHVQVPMPERQRERSSQPPHHLYRRKRTLAYSHFNKLSRAVHTKSQGFSRHAKVERQQQQIPQFRANGGVRNQTNNNKNSNPAHMRQHTVNKTFRADNVQYFKLEGYETDLRAEIQDGLRLPRLSSSTTSSGRRR